MCTKSANLGSKQYLFRTVGSLLSATLHLLKIDLLDFKIIEISDTQ